jgi:hypothetical protein
LEVIVTQAHNLNGFIMLDSFAAHREMLGWKFVKRVAAKLFIGVPEPVHWLYVTFYEFYVKENGLYD